MGDSSGWNLGSRAARDGSSVVKALMKLGSGEGKIGEILQRRIRLLVGNGKRVMFWKDIWVGKRLVMEVFPKLLQWLKIMKH